MNAQRPKITADSTPLVGNLAGAVTPPIAPATLSARVLRVPGEAFDCDQVTLPCESCGLNEYACECEVDEPSYEDWAAPFRRLAAGWNRVEL